MRNRIAPHVFGDFRGGVQFPESSPRFTADIVALLKHIRPNRLPDRFEPLRRDRLPDFARVFDLENGIRKMRKENLDQSSAGRMRRRGNFFGEGDESPEESFPGVGNDFVFTPISFHPFSAG